MCAIISIDHCDITFIYFIKVTKDFKSKYESLKDKEIYIVCYQKPYSKKTLFFFLTGRENKISDWYQIIFIVKQWLFT